MPHRIRTNPVNLLGIEIGGTKLQLALGREDGSIQVRRHLVVDPDRGGAGIRQQIEQVLPELLGGATLAAVGVGFGGPVESQTGKICCSHQLEGWSGFDLATWLNRLAAASTFVDNDANVAALGEARFGAGAGFDRVFYVTLGSGVGGGLVMGGEIYHGATPGECEIGHVRLDRQGTTVESRCSGWAVDARIRDLKSHEPSSALVGMTSNAHGGEAKHLAAAVQAGDAVAGRILAEVAEDLAFGLSHVVHLLHPHVIVLGGGLCGVGEPLRAAVQQNLRRFLMEVFQPGPELRLAALGADAVPVGALLLAGLNLKRAGKIS